MVKRSLKKVVGKIESVIFNIKQYSDRRPQKQIPFPRLVVIINLDTTWGHKGRENGNFSYNLKTRNTRF